MTRIYKVTAFNHDIEVIKADYADYDTVWIHGLPYDRQNKFEVFVDTVEEARNWLTLQALELFNTSGDAKQLAKDILEIVESTPYE